MLFRSVGAGQAFDFVVEHVFILVFEEGHVVGFVFGQVFVLGEINAQVVAAGGGVTLSGFGRMLLESPVTRFFRVKLPSCDSV